MKEYYVYILKCSDQSYYIGITNDYQRRLYEHQSGLKHTNYTHTRRPLKLVYVATFTDVYEAIVWEKQIKLWSRKKKQALIERNYEALILLAKNHQGLSGSSDSVHGSTSSP